MGRSDFSTSKHNISSTTNGSRHHSSFEAKYCSLAIRELILALEKKEAIPKFSILSVTYVLKKHIMLSRNRHSPTASENRKPPRRMLKRQLMTKRVERLESHNLEGDPVQTLGADLSILKERFADQIDADILLDEYVNFGIEVSTSHGKQTKTEIIRTQEDNSDDEKISNLEGEPIIKPGIKEMQNLLQFSKISASILSSESQ